MLAKASSDYFLLAFSPEIYTLPKPAKMNKQTILNGVALVNFIALVALFLLYKNGNFNHTAPDITQVKSSRTDTGQLTNATRDSLTKKIDGQQRLRWSSSKSVVAIDHFPENIDTATSKKENTNPKLAPITSMKLEGKK